MQLVTALKKLGFTEVWEGAFGVELVSQAYKKLITPVSGLPLISSFCPVIVFYIQKYLTQLVPNLAPIVSPMIAIGKVARKMKGDDWKIVYITPCLAQMKEINTPEVTGIIDYALSFDDIKQMLDEAKIELDKLETGIEYRWGIDVTHGIAHANGKLQLIRSPLGQVVAGCAGNGVVF